MTSYLSSVDVLHYKAQPILCLERVLQRLQHNIKIYFKPSYTLMFVSNNTDSL